MFNDSVSALNEIAGGVQVTFETGPQRVFDLVFGCDGLHSTVRKLWFGDETKYMHFLEQYFSITIVNKLLISENTSQLYNVPGKAVMLNAYNNKTDIIFCFVSEEEIPYDYRDEQQQRKIIREQFTGESWKNGKTTGRSRKVENVLFRQIVSNKDAILDKRPGGTGGRCRLLRVARCGHGWIVGNRRS